MSWSDRGEVSLDGNIIIIIIIIIIISYFFRVYYLTTADHSGCAV
jgi:hypothetical protein